MFNKRHLIYMLLGVLIVLSLSTVGGATTSEYDYERDAPANASYGETIEVTLDVHTEGGVIEDLDEYLVDPKITESSAEMARAMDGEVVALFEEPGTLTYEVTVVGLADTEDTERKITSNTTSLLEAPDTVITVNGTVWGDVIGLQAVGDAIDDWRSGDISTHILKDIIAYWRGGETIVE